VPNINFNAILLFIAFGGLLIAFVGAIFSWNSWYSEWGLLKELLRSLGIRHALFWTITAFVVVVIAGVLMTLHNLSHMRVTR
jgi:hypothetical protein